MYRRYLKYDKGSLFDKIDKISIESVGSQVVTKYDNRVISTSNVSRRYEIFDIKSYLRSRIGSIEKNFDIDFNKVLYITDTGRQWNNENF